MARRRRHWGWGYEDEAPPFEEVRAAASGLEAHLGFGGEIVEEAAPLEQVRLEPPRVEIPDELRAIATDDTHARALNGQGRSYSDIVRGFRGLFPHPPDFVVHAASEDDVRRTLAWAGEQRVAVTPVGGGTSVVGGIEARPGRDHVGAIAMSLRPMNAVLAVDDVSRAARIQAGAAGPELESRCASAT